MSYAAGVDKNQIGLASGIDLVESETFEEFSNLLALVLIYFAAESIYGKSFQSMV